MSEPTNPLIAAKDVEPCAVAWLWPKRLALGKLAMFDGDPGRAKSLVTLDLCARISTGRPMPDATTTTEPANVVVIQGEDGAADTVMPRLRALGADLGRVFLLRAPLPGSMSTFHLPRHIPLIDNALALNKPRLLVIDPITAFLDSRIITGSDQSIRRALSPLGRMLERHACAGILVRHLNKSDGAKSLYRGGGTIGFNAACRSSWLFAAEPHDQDRLVMAQIKNNLAERQPSLAYRVVESGADKTPIIEWLGPSRRSADQLLADPTATPRRLRDSAAEFLLDFLAAGPRTTGDIWSAAKQRGMGKRTLQIARAALGLRSLRAWKDGTSLTFWLKEGQDLPSNLRADKTGDVMIAGVAIRDMDDPLWEAE